MRKLILALLLSFCLYSPAVAADSLVIRVEEPKSPTNDNTFDITFVVLDTVGDRNISVSCDSNGTPFYSTTITPAGNTGVCPVTDKVITQNGTYTITATATAGEESVASTVSFDYNNDSPDTPRDYQKHKISDCTYEIKFKTADDNGKTAKVELYRSTDTSFTADNGSRVAEINIGSNTDSILKNTVPECNKTYYYALRAFSSAGNGSGIVKDREVKVVETDEVVTQAAAPAIPVRNNTPVGLTKPQQTSPQPTASESGLILGVEESTESASPAATPITKAGINWQFILVMSAIISLLMFVYRRFSK